MRSKSVPVFAGPALSTREIAKRFPSLSQSQALVCSLVSSRLTTSEIATCLSISRRTVEKHLENVFKKLCVRSREQLRSRLGVLPPSTNWIPERLLRPLSGRTAARPRKA